jgi:hypothetical protein
MSNQYIIKFSNNKYAESIDALAEINKTMYNVPILNVKSSDNNTSLLNQFITNSISEVNFDNTKMEFNFNSFKIIFDKNSSSAYSQFKKELINMINTKFETEYYESGNIYYIGEVLSILNEETIRRVPHGEGFMYYDSPDNKIKYSGEFEDGKFDGAGIFYNRTGNITLKANNITKNIPQQKGKLDVKFKSKNETFDVNFFEIWEDINVLDDKSISELVMSDDFIDRLTDFFCDYDDDTFDNLQFECKSTDEKLVEIRKQLLEITKDIDNKHNDIIEIVRNNYYNIVIIEILLCIFISIVFHKN